ncbi:helix-turn-helix domain-containing protein [Streptomyces longispororuber]|uniref:helix-turn-helix domain-containing protein n=1 Tax=Streptomyces longispororuber TaxID=68230 RepID=UPI0027E34B5F|nr:helix-turn-helix transcriptional regulator [Streptomyces longispororuber]
MLGGAPPFGAELRRLRMAAGLTLAEFAAAVHYSKGQISKVETGRKRASAEFARLCDAALDAALDADGTLIGLVPSAPPPAHRPAEPGSPKTPDHAPSTWSTPTRRERLCGNRQARGPVTTRRPGPPEGEPGPAVVGGDYSPAALRSASTRSVFSQVKSGSARPKWP